MPDKNSYYCPICGTELGSSRELHDHETKRHSKDVGERDDSSSDQGRQQDRKHHTFERRNWE